MKRVLLFIVRTVGAQTLVTVMLLLTTLGATAEGLAGLVRPLEPALLFSSVVVGILVSWCIARTRVRSVLGIAMVSAIGLTVIAFEVGHLGGRLAMVFQELVDLDTQIRFGAFRIVPDWQPLITGVGELCADLGTLFARVRDWLQSMLGGRAEFDPVAASIVWALALWFVASWAAWGIRRTRRALVALLPSLTLLAAIYAYSGADILLLAAPVLSLLVLMVVTGHGAREARWRAARMDYSEDIRFDIALVVGPLCFALVAAGWLMPSLSIRELARMAQEVISAPAKQAQPLPNSLGLKAAPVAQEPLPVPVSPGLPRSHLLGSGPELSHEVVMLVHTGDLPALPLYGETSGQTPQRYYWRSTVYDQYNGSGWVTSGINGTDYGAGADAISKTVAVDRIVRQEVQFTSDIGRSVYSAGRLVSTDRDFRILWRANDDLFTALFTRASSSYTADSLIPIATTNQLRSTDSKYPEWIRKRYLQLSEDVPQRVLTLARDLTATSPTPFDRAAAIESYLRTYSYTLDLPAPPSGHDVADYFLFDLKRGYCDYFATAMVVLARAAGLPARLVVGYASGQYDYANAQYMVTQADAHSWPEVYFNNYGWIEFEPTSGRAPIQHTDAEQKLTGEGKLLNPLQPRYLWTDALGWLVPLALAIVALLAAVGWFVIDSWWLRRKPPREIADRLFRRLRSQGTRIAVRALPGDTPFEYTVSLSQYMARAVPGRGFGGSVVRQESDLARLAELYVRSTYSQVPPDRIEAQAALHIWRHAIGRLWLAWLWRVLGRLRPRIRTHAAGE